jgi:hypothetical protein
MPDYGDGLKGAAGGAMTGAALGSVVPGVGTAIGAGVGGIAGGLLGLFGGGKDDEQKRLLEEYRRQVMAREAPQIGPASQAATSDFRTNQQDLVKRLEAQANGTAPSIVDAQLRQATDRNMAQQSSIAQSGRGNPTLAGIVAANNSANFGQAASQSAVAGRLAEQQMANQQLSGTLQGARGTDEQTSQFNAQQQNFANQANLEAKLRTMGLNDTAIMNIMQQVNGINAKPTLGEQLLAGGTGALGMFAANRGKAS